MVVLLCSSIVSRDCGLFLNDNDPWTSELLCRAIWLAGFLEGQSVAKSFTLAVSIMGRILFPKYNRQLDGGSEDEVMMRTDSLVFWISRYSVASLCSRQLWHHQQIQQRVVFFLIVLHLVSFSDISVALFHSSPLLCCRCVEQASTAWRLCSHRSPRPPSCDSPETDTRANRGGGQWLRFRRCQ